MLLFAAAGGGAGEGAGPLGGDRPAADYYAPAGGAAAGDGRVRLKIMALTLLPARRRWGFAAPGVGLTAGLAARRRPCWAFLRCR